MTQRQRESAAKYCYDLSKVVMTIAGIANLFSGRFDLVNFLLGLVGGIGL